LTSQREAKYAHASIWYDRSLQAVEDTAWDVTIHKVTIKRVANAKQAMERRAADEGKKIAGTCMALVNVSTVSTFIYLCLPFS